METPFHSVQTADRQMSIKVRIYSRNLNDEFARFGLRLEMPQQPAEFCMTLTVG